MNHRRIFSFTSPYFFFTPPARDVGRRTNLDLQSEIHVFIIPSSAARVTRSLQEI